MSRDFTFKEHLLKEILKLKKNMEEFENNVYTRLYSRKMYVSKIMHNINL